MRPNPFSCLSLLVGLCLALPAWSDVEHRVELTLQGGTVATANFRAGSPEKPALLVLHGFLQTSAFPTVASIVAAGTTAGHATLAPTLSLGISRRNKSLPCEAVHLHSLGNDAAEVAHWVRWLEKQGYSRVILVGHSYGSLQLLEYLDQKRPPGVARALLISLADVERKQSARQRAAIAASLSERLARGDTSLVEAELGHCRKYVSPPAAMLSYMSISRARILESLARARVPVEVIMGSRDERMGSDWVDKLVSRGVAVRVIPGASHFFDDQYEFDLQEAVLHVLRGNSTGR